VSVLDDLSTGRRENLAGLAGSNRFRLIEGSVLDAELVQGLVDDADVIFHLAAAVGVKLIMDEPSKSILTNINGTENVLKAALKDKKLTFIASTSEVYGKATKFPFAEDDDLTIGATRNLRWSYACAKMLDEFLALAHHRESGLPATVLRFFNTTGPRQTGRYGMVLPNFVEAALDGRPLKVHGTGEQSRCFGHVADVVEALMRLIDCDASIGQVYNIGNDEEISISELARLVKGMTGSDSEIHYIPYEEAYGPGFEDTARRVPSLEKLERLLGYRPTTSLRDALELVARETRPDFRNPRVVPAAS